MASGGQLSRMIFESMCSGSRKWSYISGPLYRDRGRKISSLWSCSEVQQTKAHFSRSACFNNKAKEAEVEENLDKPIKFTTSQASKYTATDSLSGDANPDSPSWQPEVVCFSVAAFLIYFLYLREENDFDLEMEKPLWEKVPNIERQQLQVVLEYNRAHNLETADIEKRLKEVLEAEAIVKAKAKLTFKTA